MAEIIKIDMFDNRRLENQYFFNLLDPIKWDKLKQKLKDPSNTKKLDELLKELMEGR